MAYIDSSFNQFLPGVVTPDAYGIGRYGRIPVNRFSGLPDINIPLTEVRGRGYKLPVSLQYYGGGIKVEQHPGCVGLGWSLMAGGRITRVIHGSHDELDMGSTEKRGYLYHMDETQKTKDWNDDTVLSELTDQMDQTDYDPDEYIVNVDGLSASFYLTGENEIAIVSQGESAFVLESYDLVYDGTKSLVLYPDISSAAELKAIRYTYIKSFILRDKNGNRYIFGGDDSAIEYSVKLIPSLWYDGTRYQNSGGWGDAVAVATSWLLTRIERADGEVVLFGYEKNGVPIVLNSIHHGISVVASDGTPYATDDTYADFLSSGLRYDYNIHFLMPSYLKSIRCLLSGDSLEFTNEAATQLPYDISEDDFKLHVTHFIGISGGLSYNQFMENSRYMKLTRITGKDRDIRLSYTDSADTRLKLLSVGFYKDGSLDNRYEFGYNSLSLPPYNTKKTDVWGYYNGIDYSSLLGGFGHDFDETRVPSESYMKAEILETITYPTGGRTEFEYEAHRFSKEFDPQTVSLLQYLTEQTAGGLRVKSITDYESEDDIQGRTRQFDYMGSGILGTRARNFVEGTSSPSGSLQTDAAFAMYSEEPILPLSETDGCHVTYSSVKEILPDGGYVIYRYSNFDSSQGMDTAPSNSNRWMSASPLYPRLTSRALFRGLPVTAEYYRSDGVLVRKEENTYGDIGQDLTFKAVTADRYSGYLIVVSYRQCRCGYPALLSSKTTERMDDGTMVTDTINYTDNNSRLLVSTNHVRGLQSEGTTVFYPEERSGNSYEAMLSAGMYGVPVGNVGLRDGMVVSASETVYREIDLDATEATAARTGVAIHKIYSGKFSAPVSPASYKADPMAYMQSTPDVEFALYDGKGNPLLIGTGDGSALEYHWTQRSSQLAMMHRTAFSGAGDVSTGQDLRLPFNQTPLVDKTFKTSEDGTQFTCYLSARYMYGWELLVRLDGQDYHLTSWAKPEMPDSWWQGIISSSVGSSLTLSLQAGTHTLQIKSLQWSGSGSDVDGGSMRYSHYMVSTLSLESEFIDLDTESETGEGFHCEKGHAGTLSINYPVKNGGYVLDYMLKDGGVWGYCRNEYSGGPVSIGGQGKTLSNVRLYPKGTLAESFNWKSPERPGAGIDAKGISESYDYDGLGRLGEVYDNTGNGLRRYSYAFKSGSTAQNRVRTEISLDAAGTVMRTTSDYYDGLGGKVQTVLTNGGGQGVDIVTKTEYDACGRVEKEWTAAPVQAGSSRQGGDMATEQQFLAGGDTVYGSQDRQRYSLSVHEQSSRDRVVEKYGPGKAWSDNDKCDSFEMLSNTSTASQETYHRGFSLSWNGQTLTLNRKGATAAGNLVITATVDEDGRRGLEFKDLYGKTVMTRLIGGTSPAGWNDTHFIYDAFGRLAAILPPKLVAELENSGTASWTEADIASLAFLYRYDSRGNCIARSIPGGGWTYTVYDRGGRAVFSQDAVLRQSGKWMFFLSDLNGRECVRGTASISLDVFGEPLAESNVYVTMPLTPSYGGTLKGYSLSGMAPLTGVELLSVRYYDNYGFLGTSPFPAAGNADVSFDQSAGAGYGSWYQTSQAGLETGRLTKVLGGSPTQSSFLWTVMYYDERSRIVQRSSSTLPGGLDREYLGYDFVGNVVKRRLTHRQPSGTVRTEEEMRTYDQAGKLLTVTHCLDGGTAKTIVDNAYDGIGRLTGIRRNAATALREQRTYNIRSWLTGISSGCFSEQLGYNDADTPLWSGDIASMSWQAAGSPGRRYRFDYDGLGRLVTATYDENGQNTGLFGESYSYDKNGNMASRTRNGAGTVYSFEGNRMTSDGSAAYGYDAKGRLVSASAGRLRGVSYNVLDLPETMTLDAGASLSLVYGADGTKLREETVSGGSTTVRDYCGNCIYENGTLKKILFSGGYIDTSAPSPKYLFFLKDHLGSVRAVADEQGTVCQENHYYPYGDSFADARIPVQTRDNSYKFCGKEYGSGSGLYDFSARFLDPVAGRFLTLDPAAGETPSLSPYLYCAANPLNVVDPDGKREWPVNEKYKDAIRRHENNFGEDRRGRKHRGLDINLGGGSDDYGAPVYATHSGIITRLVDVGKMQDSDAGGSRVQVTAYGDKDTVSTYYMHLSKIESSLKIGDFIEEGTLLGNIGNSSAGRVNNSNMAVHLHYELIVNGAHINPVIDADRLLDPMGILGQVPEYEGGILPEAIKTATGNIMPKIKREAVRKDNDDELL